MYSKTVTIFDVDINYKDTVGLYEKTGFSIAEVIAYGFYDNCHNIITIKDLTINLSLMTLFTDNDCKNGNFCIFATVYDEDRSKYQEIINEPTVRKQILEQVKICVEDINNEISKYKIPIDNLENIKYIEKEDKFYQVIGTPTPTVITIKCELNQTIEDVSWS